MIGQFLVLYFILFLFYNIQKKKIVVHNLGKWVAQGTFY